MSEWWEDLDEVERATWAMVIIMAFGVLVNIMLRIIQLCSQA